MHDSLSKTRGRGCIVVGSEGSSCQCELAPSQKHLSKLDTSARNPSKILSVDHQDDGEESSEVRSSVAAARSTLEQRQEAVLVAAQTQKADAELSLCWPTQRHASHFWNRR